MHHPRQSRIMVAEILSRELSLDFENWNIHLVSSSYSVWKGTAAAWLTELPQHFMLSFFIMQCWSDSDALLSLRDSCEGNVKFWIPGIVLLSSVDEAWDGAKDRSNFHFKSLGNSCWCTGLQESTVGVVAMGQLGLLFFQRVDYCCDIDCQKLKHVIYVCAQGCGSSWSYMLWQSSLTF